MFTPQKGRFGFTLVNSLPEQLERPGNGRKTRTEPMIIWTEAEGRPQLFFVSRNGPLFYFFHLTVVCWNAISTYDMSEEYYPRNKKRQFLPRKFSPCLKSLSNTVCGRSKCSGTFSKNSMMSINFTTILRFRSPKTYSRTQLMWPGQFWAYEGFPMKPTVPWRRSSE